MIARILLLIVAWFGFTYAVDGLKINARYSGAPDSFSLSQLESPVLTMPAFVHITDANLSLGVCQTETMSKDDKTTSSRFLYVPLMDPMQLELYSQGKPVKIKVLSRSDDCDKAPTLMQGILSSEESIDDEIRDKFNKSNIFIDNNPLILTPQYAPASSGSNILILLLSLLAAIAAIVPFFKRDKWPKEKQLKGMPLPEVLAALYPALKVEDNLARALEKGRPSFVDPEEPEVVLLKLNCVNAAKRPSFAIFINKRYLLYRTKIQFGLILLKATGSALDKIPVVGGLVSMMVEPFEESYEVILAPEDPRFHETMGYENSALLAGKVPWHKTCDIALADLPKTVKSVVIKKRTWSGGLGVLFMPHSLKGIFIAPSNFNILQDGQFVAVLKLIECLGSTIANQGLMVKQDEGKVEISLPRG